MRKIILASTSPRRKELLGATGLEFEVVAGRYEEDMTLPLTPEELAKHLSRGKAESLQAEYPDAVIIGADTFVVFDGKVLGKPHTPEKARETLSMLSGKKHSVITGFTIIDTKSGKSLSQVVASFIHMKELSPGVIEKYVATGEPLDKAGSYAVQGLGGELVDRTEGDYSNIVGLPIEAVLTCLREEFGVKI